MRAPQGPFDLAMAASAVSGPLDAVLLELRDRSWLRTVPCDRPNGVAEWQFMWMRHVREWVHTRA